MQKGETKMKARMCYFALIVLILVLGLAGCASPAKPPAPTPTALSPAEHPNSKMVLSMVERLNAGDVDGSLAYFADNAIIYFVGMPPTGMEIYWGKDQLRPIWQDCADNHFIWEVEITSADDRTVTARTKTWHDFTRQIGVAPNEYTDVYEIKDGKIVDYSSTITEEALARFRPALAQVMPPQPTSIPSSGTPATEISVTIVNGTCAYNGPMTLKAGELKLIAEIKDQDKDGYAVSFFTLNPGKDMVDLMAATAQAAPPSWSKTVFLKEMGPNESLTRNITVSEGPLYLVCWSKPPDQAIGAAGPFEVVP
jgi:hypothetical protein